MKSKLKNLILSIGSLLLILMITEIILSVFYPVDYMKPIKTQRRDTWTKMMHRRSDIPGLSYELVPNAQESAVWTYVTVNSFGMRDIEREIQKKSGTKRIAVLGDSFTFGFSIDSEDLFTRVLERMLNDSIDNQGYQFEVLNFGVGGYSIRDEALVLEYKVPQWNPDLVIINYVLNDALMDPDQPLHKYFRDTKWWQHLNITRLVAERTHNPVPKEPRLSDFLTRIYYPDYHNWKGVEKAFSDIKKTAIANDYNIVLLVFAEIPNGENWDNYDHIRQFEEQVINEGKMNDFYIMDLYDEFVKHAPGKLRVSEKDHHPNIKGHYLTAKFLKDQLTGEHKSLLFD